MKRKWMILFLCMLLFSFSSHAIEFVAEDIYASVVVVYTHDGVGSGFCVQDGFILTNAHVVGDDRRVSICLYDGTTVSGTVVKTNAFKDLAWVKVQKSLPTLDMNLERASVGQEVYVIGAPKDMPYTMTKGIVSALDRELRLQRYIQVDASVNSGNSGGPLLNEQGEVLGIITLKADDAEGIGFALGVDEILKFIEDAHDESEAEAQAPTAEEEPVEEASVDDGEETLRKENDRLKIAVCISGMLNIVLLLLYLILGLKNKTRKEKDPFDFEIEIEE